MKHLWSNRRSQMVPVIMPHYGECPWTPVVVRDWQVPSSSQNRMCSCSRSRNNGSGYSWSWSRHRFSSKSRSHR